MTRSPFSLKSAHLLMWSSPLLLIILVFTLTTGSTPRVPAASSRPPSSTSPVTTQVPNSTTSTIPTTRASVPVIVTAKATAPTQTAPSTTRSTSSVDNSFSSVTTTTAKPVAPTSNANAMSGELSGTLNPGFESVDVPLLGPGNWTLSSSGPTSQSLNCGADTSPVELQVVVGSNQSCQLEITSTSVGPSLSWQLTPNT